MKNSLKNIMFVFKKLTAKSNQQTASSGFTIIELVTVIAIFGIMASIVLFKFQTFTTRVDMNNLAQDIALRIVGAQKASISGVQNASTLVDNTLIPSYGIYFGNGDANGTDKQFVYFADVGPQNKIFDPYGNVWSNIACSPTQAVGQECISVTSITTGEKITNLCFKSNPPSGELDYCLGSSGQLFVTFERPFPNATFSVRDGQSSSLYQNVYEAQVELTSEVDPSLQKTIIITSLGQIRVQDGSNTIS